MVDDPAPGPVLEVACDESGSDGENLTGGNTDVFTHASVALDSAAAGACIRETRRRVRSPATEYKANVLLREKHRPVVRWLLGSPGPIAGRARVLLVDKAYFLLGRLVQVLDPGPGEDRRARTLYREGGALPPERWRSFLDAANALLRARTAPGAPPPADGFFAALDDLPTGGRLGELAARLRAGRDRAEDFRAHLRDDPTRAPALDPLIPALVGTIVRWAGPNSEPTPGPLRSSLRCGAHGPMAGTGRPVSIVHHRQTTLTEDRVARMRDLLRASDLPDGALAGLRLVSSESDPRVQIADFLAGIARKIASDELNGRGDPELTALLAPFVDTTSSLWADERSWSRLVHR